MNHSNDDLLNLNKRAYDKIAPTFSASRSYVWPDLESFKKYIKDGDRVLDLGCGNGRLLALFEGKKVEYLGVDFSERLIEQARQSWPDKQFEVMDALNLRLPDNSFDVVLCVSVLNHIPRDKQDLFMSNVRRVLKPEGVLLMANWNLWNVFNKKSVWFNGLKKDVMTVWKGGRENERLYYYAFTKRELKNGLERGGLAVEQNFYSKKGKRSSWLFGENVVTTAKLKN